MGDLIHDARGRTDCRYTGSYPWRHPGCHRRRGHPGEQTPVQRAGQARQYLPITALHHPDGTDRTVHTSRGRYLDRNDRIDCTAGCSDSSLLCPSDPKCIGGSRCRRHRSGTVNGCQPLGNHLPCLPEGRLARHHPRIIRNDHQPDRFDGNGWSHRRRWLG